MILNENKTRKYKINNRRKQLKQVKAIPTDIYLYMYIQILY